MPSLIRGLAQELAAKCQIRQRVPKGLRTPSPSCYSIPIPPLASVWASICSELGVQIYEARTRDFTGLGKDGEGGGGLKKKKKSLPWPHRATQDK